MKDDAWGTFFILLGVAILYFRLMSKADDYFNTAADRALTVVLIIGAVILGAVAVAAPTPIKAATAAWIVLP